MQQDAVKETVLNAVDQGEALIALYKMVFPNWDAIKTIDGWPKVNAKTWRHIATHFQDLDQEKHPEVIPGGLWMNSGFSTTEGLEDWEVLVDCEIEEE